MTIKDKRTGDIYSDFPNYGKHDFQGSHYGSLVVTRDERVLYFFVDHSSELPSLDYTDVSRFFEFKIKP